MSYFCAVLVCSGYVSAAQAGDSTSGLVYLGYVIWAGFFFGVTFLLWRILRNTLLGQGKEAMSYLITLILILAVFWKDLSQLVSSIIN